MLSPSSSRKNAYYLELLCNLSPADMLPGVMVFIGELKKRGIKTAAGSSSRNVYPILDRIALRDCFDAVVGGNDIEKSKTDLEVFLSAARRLDLKPGECLVVEDAAAGVEAGIRAWMPVLAVGSAVDDALARMSLPDLPGILVDAILKAVRFTEEPGM